MSYLLQQTHDVLQHCLQADESIAVNVPGSSLFTPVWEEIRNFRSGFLQSAASSPSAESMKILAEITATGCIDVLNKVSLLRQQSGEKADDPLGLSRLESSLEEILSWLQTSFSSFISKDMPMPRSLAGKEWANSCRVLSELSANTKAPVSADWLAIISDLATKTFRDSNTIPSCRLASYFRSLLSGIREVSLSELVNTTVMDDYTKLFIRYNANDASVTQYIIRKLTGEAGESLSLAGQIEKWEWFRKELTQVMEVGTGLLPDAPSVKSSLLSVISSELSWLQKKESSLSSVYGNRLSPAPASVALSPLLTALSVSQLAVWCRLFCEADILKHSNQSELLKKVAGALQTTRAATISADSLRAKYYSPDRASLAIVKEHLFRMINLVKDM